MDALLNCPFCGGGDIDPAFWRDGDGDEGPGCSGCGACAETGERWNARNNPQVLFSPPKLPTDRYMGEYERAEAYRAAKEATELRVPSELLLLLADPLMGPAITRFVSDVRAALAVRDA